jgi:cytochrome c-type biogenesis protein
MAQMVQEKTSGVTPSAQGAPLSAQRASIFFHSVMFVLGFTIIFTLIGSAFGLLGRSLDAYMPVIQRLGAILLTILGLAMLGVFRRLSGQIEARFDPAHNPSAQALVNVLSFFNTLLYSERRVAELHTINRNWGYFSSILLGMSFAAGWTPCIGPILGGILTMAGQSATATQGALLLAIYSLGLGLPFLLTGAAFGSAINLLRRMHRYLNWVSIISGIFLLVVAWILWSNSLATLSGRFLFMSDWAIAVEEWLGAVSGTGGMINGLSLLAAAPLAFAGGIISFISPCVLPLVPAYLGFLSGAAVAKTKQAEA